MSEAAASAGGMAESGMPRARESVPPHPPIDGYYAQPGEKRSFVTSIFDETAADYDRVERWLSLGTGAWYRRQVLERVGLKPGMLVADVAVGTGLVAREALRLMAVNGITQGRVVGVDPSEGMLAQAHAKLNIETVRGMADSLPLPDACFDLVTMGYALRHVDDLGLAFSEFRRVLKPGGMVCVLEITRPKSRLARAMLRAYLGAVGGIVGRLTALAPRTPELWKYYWETIDQCVAPERVLEALRAAGFRDVKRSALGVFSEYTGVAED